jgi:hypothetical protein
MIVRFSNPIGTRVRIEHDDGHVEDIPTNDQDYPPWLNLLALMAAGELTIEPYGSSNAPQQASRKKAKK